MNKLPPPPPPCNVNKREFWVDVSKTILIFVMVVGHCNPYLWVRTLIYGCHMPAFFIISGYLYKPHDWKKTTKSFFIPIVFFSLINLMAVLINYTDGTPFPDDFLKKCLYPFFMFSYEYGIPLVRGVWFVICLYFCRLLFGDIPFTNPIRKFIYPIAIVCIVFLSLRFLMPESILHHKLNSLYLIRTVACIPFFAFGIWCKEHSDLLQKIPRCVVYILFPVYIAGCFMNGGIDIWAEDYGVNYFFSFIISVIGFWLLYRGTRLTIFSGAASVFQIFSTGTFFVLGTHILLRDVYWRWLGINKSTNWYQAILTGVVIMLLCYYPIKILIKKCPILIGK